MLGIRLNHQGEVQRVKIGLDYSVEVQWIWGRTRLLGTWCKVGKWGWAIRWRLLLERLECHIKFALHSACLGEALSALGWEPCESLSWLWVTPEAQSWPGGGYRLGGWQWEENWIRGEYAGPSLLITKRINEGKLPKTWHLPVGK